MTFYVDARLGPKQALLPSGSLLCRDVVLGRTGAQIYHPSEIGQPGSVLVSVYRDPAEVFDPEAMASFEGVAITLNHPDDPVDPSTWRSVSVGHIQGVRRDGDYLVADLIVNDRAAIDKIRNQGWRGVSLGYTCEYIRDAAGRLKQVDIRGNHAAILGPYEEPRCGDACMVGDSVPRKETSMPTLKIVENQRKAPKLPPLVSPIADLDAKLERFKRNWRQPSRDAVDPDLSGATEMGTKPGAPAGATLVAKLPGPTSAYFIAADGDGTACLYRSSDIEGVLDPGVVQDTQRARIAASAAASRATMRAINEANAKFWKR
jgi:uncharacterized protein